MPSDLTILGSALCILLGYSFLSLRLSRTFQPLRLEVVGSIEGIMADETVPADIRDDLDRLGDKLLSASAAWLLVLAYPVGVYYAIRAGRNDKSIRNHPRFNEISRTYTKGIIGMMATSPLCFFLFFVELALLMMFFVPLGRSARKALHVVLHLMNGNGRDGHGKAYS